MKISSESHLAAVVFKLSGELTVDAADGFRRTVQETVDLAQSNVILDCSELGLVDSVGLESFLWLSDELTQSGNKLRFASVSQTVQRVFELTRLDRVFCMQDTVEAAARSFA